MIRTIIRGPDPRLRKRAPSITFPPPEVAQDLMDTMNEHPRALGLAANQIGHDERVIIIRRATGLLVMIDPIIKEQSAEMVIQQEECMSFPWLKVKVSRPWSGRIAWTEKAKRHEYREGHFSGMDFRVILHEIDHCDGITLEQRRRKRG